MVRREVGLPGRSELVGPNDECRLQPLGFRGAQVSQMHANYFVNTGAGTAADVRALIERAQREVEARFGGRLEPEVKLIGRSGEYLNPE